MKYLLVTLLIVVVFWIWRSGRASHKPVAQPQRRPGKLGPSPEMVACGVCQVHLPKSEALIGRDGFYCSEAHRREAGA